MRVSAGPSFSWGTILRWNGPKLGQNNTVISDELILILTVNWHKLSLVCHNNRTINIFTAIKSWTNVTFYNLYLIMLYGCVFLSFVSLCVCVCVCKCGIVCHCETVCSCVSVAACLPQTFVKNFIKNYKIFDKKKIKKLTFPVANS